MKFRTLLVALFVTATLGACNGGGGGDSGTPSAQQDATSPQASTVKTIGINIPSSQTFVVGETLQLVASPTDAAGKLIAGKTVQWSTSDASVLEISPAGMLTAKSAGNATIMATLDGITSFAPVKIQVAGTKVSGMIDGNTIWGIANSPYRLSGTVQIKPGATLTIEPGVEVYGEDIPLIVAGSFKTLGTVQDKVLLSKMNIVPAGSITAPHNIEIRFANVQGGRIYAATGNGIYGTLTLADSKFTDIQSPIYIWYPTSDVVIERNIFLNSEGISAGFDSRATPISVIVRNNYFKDWKSSYAISCWASYGSATGVVVERNTFATAGKTAINLPGGYTSAAMTATNNWWGTTDTSAIANMINDQNDDVTSAGVIQFQPLLSGPDAQTPAP